MNRSVVVRVAGKELRYLCFSPIGWLVAAIFVIQISAHFLGVLDFYFGRGAFEPNAFGYAQSLFTAGATGVYRKVIEEVYLLIPLLTMAVFSREISSGTIRLLLSSPVRTSELVLGKYVGISAYLLFFVLVLAALVILAKISVPKFDHPATLPGLLGIYLLICTYAAIGVFVSSLTRFQVVAAVTTLAILFFLQSVAGWLQTVPILNELSAWASISNRANTLRSGLISTPDIVYFVVLIGTFFVFTVLRISSLRTGDRMRCLVLKGIGFATLAAVLGWVLSLPQLSSFIDTTYDRRNSLSPETIALMERLEGPWEIVTYANLLDRMGTRTRPDDQIMDRQRWRLYRHLNPNLRMSYRRYYDIDGANEVFRRPEPDDRTDEEIVREYARRVGLNPNGLVSGEDLDRNVDIDLRAEGFRSVRVLKWEDRQAILRHFSDNESFAAERTRAAAISRLVIGPALVGVVSAGGERSIQGFGPKDYRQRFNRKDDRFSLVNHGFDLLELDLTAPIPAEVDVLLIADPSRDYGPEAMDKVQEYIEGGGNLVLLIEPDSSTAADELLAKLGLSRGEPVFQKDDPRYPTEFVLATAQSGVLDAYWGPSILDAPVALVGASSLEVATRDDEFTRSPVLVADNQVVAYSLQRDIEGKRQRIVVYGDADLFSTANAELRQPITNTSTYFDTFHWLTEGAYPVQRTREGSVDRTLRIERNTLSILHWVLKGLIPILILAFGAWLLTSRRRR